MNNLIFQKKIKKLDLNGIFKPTDTTRLLVNASQQYLKKNQRVLDLGCGSGVITYLVYNKKLNQKFFLSDLHSKAIEKSKINLKKKNISAVFNVGNLYDPWNNSLPLSKSIYSFFILKASVFLIAVKIIN